MKNILLTSAGKRVVLVQIFQKTINELGVDSKVYTADIKPDMAPACIVSDDSFVVPRCTDRYYVDKLLDICRSQNVGVIIPTIDTELLVWRRTNNALMRQV